MTYRPSVHKTGDASMLDQLKSQFFEGEIQEGKFFTDLTKIF